MPRFAGIPVDTQTQAKDPRFAGVPVDDSQQPDQMPTQVVHTDARLPGVLGDINDFGNDLGDAFVHNLAKLPVSVAQIGAHGLNSLIQAGAPAPQQNLSGLITGTAPSRQGIGGQIADYAQSKVGQLDNAIQSNEAQYQKDVPTNTASVIGATIGNVLPFAVGGEVAAIPKATTTLGKIGLGALTGGGVGALQPVTTGAQQGDKTPSFAQQKAEQIGAGAITGGALPATGALARKAIGSVSPEVQALAQKATNYGIDLTGPQISDSVAMKVANKTTGQVPFSGATAFAQKQQGQFNNAVAQTIGLPDGTTKIPPDVFRAAKQKASQGFNTLWQNNHLPIDQHLVHDMVSIGNEAHRIGSGDSSRIINNVIDDVVNKGQSGTLDGRAFQVIDSQLGKLATSQDSSTAHYASELQDVLRQKIQNNMAPDDAAKLMELRGQWRNILNLTPILTEGSGNVPPSRLLAAVANNKAGKTQLATGTRGDLGELAQIGKQFLRDPVPDSGTAMRNVAFDTLKGMGAITAGATTGIGIPTALGTMGAARAIQSGLRSRSLFNALAKLPQNQQTPIRNALSVLMQQQAAKSTNSLNQGTTP